MAEEPKNPKADYLKNHDEAWKAAEGADAKDPKKIAEGVWAAVGLDHKLFVAAYNAYDKDPKNPSLAKTEVSALNDELKKLKENPALATIEEVKKIRALADTAKDALVKEIEEADKGDKDGAKAKKFAEELGKETPDAKPDDPETIKQKLTPATEAQTAAARKVMQDAVDASKKGLEATDKDSAEIKQNKEVFAGVDGFAVHYEKSVTKIPASEEGLLDKYIDRLKSAQDKAAKDGHEIKTPVDVPVFGLADTTGDGKISDKQQMSYAQGRQEELIKDLQAKADKAGVKAHFVAGVTAKSASERISGVGTGKMESTYDAPAEIATPAPTASADGVKLHEPIDLSKIKKPEELEKKLEGDVIDFDKAALKGDKTLKSKSRFVDMEVAGDAKVDAAGLQKKLDKDEAGVKHNVVQTGNTVRVTFSPGAP